MKLGLFSRAPSKKKFGAAVSMVRLHARHRYLRPAATLFIAPLLTVLSEQATALDIKHVTLEQLMSIEVYSASRHLEPIRTVPGAIYVLTGEDIQRAHVTSIPEALRLVPGVQVAKVDANKWAVSIRGFNARTSNKLLVLVDGRSIYDPLFSGVLWESKDVMLEDVDRIEVIRGPGGTLWGANAVNGVINIITKNARDTQGGLVTAGAGTEERGFGAVRYGWQPGKGQFARVYAKYFDRDDGYSPSGNAHDGTQMSRAGFRWDWSADQRDRVRMSGDWYDGEAGERNDATTTQDVSHRGGNLLASWARKLSGNEDLHAQFYYDRIELDNLQLGEKRDTYDFEFQHSLTAFSAHALVWGAGYRNTGDEIRNGPLLAVDPSRRHDTTTNIFVQDTITLSPREWLLTLGTKLENNDYTGNEWQPNARLAWTPDTRRTWWISASRAVRVPSRLERDLVFLGNRLGDNMDAEQVYAYEFGHRRLVTPRFWYDIAAFYNDYHRLFTVEQNFQFQNHMQGNTYGAEVAARWNVSGDWRLDVAYTYLRMNLTVDTGSAAATQAETIDGSSPHNELVLHSTYNLKRGFKFDTSLRYVSKLAALNVPDYATLDAAVAWSIRPDLEVSLVGRNLFDDHHPEQQIVPNGSGTEVERGAYVKLEWRI